MDFLELQFTTIKEMLNWRVSLDILLIATAIYSLYQFLRATGTWKIASGIGTAGLVFIIARILNLKGIVWIYSFLSPIILISLIIIFQPEIRKLLERAATLKGRQVGWEGSKLAFVLSDAIFHLARQQRGAVFVLPGKDSVRAWLSEGIPLDSVLSFPLLMSLFDPHSPGHDGAVLIENGRAVSYAVRLPLSTTDKLSDEYGTRHHAGMGLSEATDAFVVVISEERGQVSLFHRGEMEILNDKDTLTSRIVAHWQTVASLPTFKIPGRKRSVLITEIVASFFLAVLFWSTVVLTQSELQQVEYSVPVVYSSLPNDMVIGGERIDEISVQVLGRDSDLRRIDRSQLKVQVDLSKALPGKQKIVFTEKHIRLPSRVKLVSTDPASVELILE